MRDYITIGSTPCDEPCAQVGSADYHARARREMRAFIGQLRRVFGPEPEGAHLAVKSFPHDFGTYHEVVCYFDTDHPDSAKYALKIEAETPWEWDDQARREVLA